jgi:hypothetical protein
MVGAVFNKALRDGTLVRQPCEVCGNPKSDGYHANYFKPLDVQWLCHVHHGQEQMRLRMELRDFLKAQRGRKAK